MCACAAMAARIREVSRGTLGVSGILFVFPRGWWRAGSIGCLTRIWIFGRKICKDCFFEWIGVSPANTTGQDDV